MHVLWKGQAFPHVRAAEPQVIVNRSERKLDKLERRSPLHQTLSQLRFLTPWGQDRFEDAVH